MGRGGTRRNSKVRGWLLVFVNMHSLPCVCRVGGRVFAPLLRHFHPIAPKGKREVFFPREGHVAAAPVSLHRVWRWKHAGITDTKLSCRFGSRWLVLDVVQHTKPDFRSVCCRTNQHLPAAKHVSKLKIKKDNSRVINILPGLADFPQMKRNMAVH